MGPVIVLSDATKRAVAIVTSVLASTDRDAESIVVMAKRFARYIEMGS